MLIVFVGKGPNNLMGKGPEVLTHATLEVRTVDHCGNKALANHKNLSALAPYIPIVSRSNVLLKLSNYPTLIR